MTVTVVEKKSSTFVLWTFRNLETTGFVTYFTFGSFRIAISKSNIILNSFTFIKVRSKLYKTWISNMKIIIPYNYNWLLIIKTTS